MGKTFHRKHYDKFNYDGDGDFKKFKKRKKINDRREKRNRVLADKHENLNTPTVWVDGNLWVTE